MKILSVILLLIFQLMLNIMLNKANNVNKELMFNKINTDWIMHLIGEITIAICVINALG